jgi:chorismate synthase
MLYFLLLPLVSYDLIFFPIIAFVAVPMVETMAALVLMDQLMAHSAQCEMFPLNLALQEPVGSANSTPVLAPDLA